MGVGARSLQAELNAAAAALSGAATQLVGAVERPAALAAGAQHFGDAFNCLLGVSMEMAGHTEVLHARRSPLAALLAFKRIRALSYSG